MTGFLASVADLHEMEIARNGGADIVDLKDPSKGALGAWRAGPTKEAVAHWRGWMFPKPLLSATIGDRPMTPPAVRAAVWRFAGFGVPIIKIGVFPGGDPKGCFNSLRRLAARTRLIAVFFADLDPDFSLLDALAEAGFFGAMIDTADKTSGGLRRCLDDDVLSGFVSRAKSLGLFTGLAGSLKTEDLNPLAEISPDYLGFRGALCAGGRTGGIELARVTHIAGMIGERSRAA